MPTLRAQHKEPYIMTTTIIYFNPCRRERLRDAFAHTLQILGPRRAAAIVEALTRAYQPASSARTNYNFALHALLHITGLDGLNAISLIKEAWNEDSMAPIDGEAGTGPEPVTNITHPSTNTTQ